MMGLCEKCANKDCNHEVEPGGIVVQCGAFKSPMTNADRIRAMSDEELAETLNSSVCQQHNKCNTGQHCLKCWIDWLKQPTED